MKLHHAGCHRRRLFEKARATRKAEFFSTLLKHLILNLSQPREPLGGDGRLVESDDLRRGGTMMQMWTRMAMGIGAIGLAIAAGTGAYAMRGDDAPKPTALQEADGAPASDSEGGGLGLTAMCVEEQPDCVDTVGAPYGDFGEMQVKCAAEAPDCYEANCAADACDGGGFAACDVTDPAVLCAPLIDCTIIVPLPAEVVEIATETVTEPVEPGVAPGGQGDGGDPFIGTGCLGSDPCSISSRPDVACLPPDCVIGEGGSVVCTAPVCEIEVPRGAPDGVSSSDCPPPPVVCVEPVPGDGTVSSNCGYPCPLETIPNGAEGVPDCGVVPPPFPCPTVDTPTDPADPQGPVCVLPAPAPGAERR